LFVFFFFNDTATTEIYTLSLHDALPICHFADLVRTGYGSARIVPAVFGIAPNSCEELYATSLPRQLSAIELSTAANLLRSHGFARDHAANPMGAHAASVLGAASLPHGDVFGRMPNTARKMRALRVRLRSSATLN